MRPAVRERTLELAFFSKAGTYLHAGGSALLPGTCCWGTVPPSCNEVWKQSSVGGPGHAQLSLHSLQSQSGATEQPSCSSCFHAPYFLQLVISGFGAALNAGTLVARPVQREEKYSPCTRGSVLWCRQIQVSVSENKHLHLQVLTSSFLLKHSQTNVLHNKPLPCKHLYYKSSFNSDVQNHFLCIPWCTPAWDTLIRDPRRPGVHCLGQTAILFSLNKMIIKGVFVPILGFGDSQFPAVTHKTR